ncbi:unnamed protein product [Protopolystoma xenopodis]|uniref:Uncharacterized protein n=1 Tax=Protopolystoma xenopodis TaxID=117903 RepID=A0A3S4ZRV7_9PLAT|nr:unnamed protein product [Protopolystoma xenopodis]
MLEQLLLELAGEVPALSQVVLTERDLFLARSIWDQTGLPEALALGVPVSMLRSRITTYAKSATAAINIKANGPVDLVSAPSEAAQDAIIHIRAEETEDLDCNGVVKQRQINLSNLTLDSTQPPANSSTTPLTSLSGDITHSVTSLPLPLLDQVSWPPSHCCMAWLPSDQLSRVVVAVVGIAHVAGILRAWDSASEIDRSKLSM